VAKRCEVKDQLGRDGPVRNEKKTRLNVASGCERVPEGGVSSLSTPGEIFYDPEADSVLFAAIEKELKGSKIKVTRHPGPINSIEFAVQMANALGSMMKQMYPF
jgi:uncharacterized protein (UPF0261 family)